MGQSSSWKPAPWKLGETAHLTLNLPCTWPCGTMCCSWTRVCPPSLEPQALPGLVLRMFGKAHVWASANSQRAGGPGRADGCLGASGSREDEFATRVFSTLVSQPPQGTFPDRILMRATLRAVSLVPRHSTVLYRAHGHW